MQTNIISKIILILIYLKNLSHLRNRIIKQLKRLYIYSTRHKQIRLLKKYNNYKHIAQPNINNQIIYYLQDCKPHI